MLHSSNGLDFYPELPVTALAHVSGQVGEGVGLRALLPLAQVLDVLDHGHGQRGRGSGHPDPVIQKSQLSRIWTTLVFPSQLIGHASITSTNKSILSNPFELVTVSAPFNLVLVSNR